MAGDGKTANFFLQCGDTDVTKKYVPECKDNASNKYEDHLFYIYRNGLSCRDAHIEVWPLKNTEMKGNVVNNACETVRQLTRG